MLVHKLKSGFGNIRALVTSIVDDMLDTPLTAGGSSLEYFKAVFPSTYAPGAGLVFGVPGAGAYPAGNVMILESRLAVDPMANVVTATVGTNNLNAAYRIAFVLHNDYSLTVHAGTRVTLPGNAEANPTSTPGELVFLTNRSTQIANLEFREPAGCMNIKPWSNYTLTNNIFPEIPAGTLGAAAPAYTLPGPKWDDPAELFISRVTSIGAGQAYPMSYALTMNNRGIVLVVWEDNQEEIPETALPAAGFGLNSNNVDLSKVYGNSPVRWFAIQRAVDRETGQVRGGYPLRLNLPYKDATTGFINEKSRCPVFCVFGTSTPNEYRKFTVRENDSVVPSPKRHAAVNTHDSPAIINPLQQQSVTEQGEFVVTFLNNLSTARYRYGDEMDLIGTVGAEVAGVGTNIVVRVYNDTQNRTYTAMYANQQYGNGMRIMMLTAASETDEETQTGIDYDAIGTNNFTY